MTHQILTSCIPKDNITKTILIKTRQSESNRLLSYLPPRLLPPLKHRWIKGYRWIVRAWEQNRWLFHWEKKLAELTYFPPSDFSCSDCNSFNSMSSILFWTYIRINTKRVITRFGQADFSFTNSSMRTLRKQSICLCSRMPQKRRARKLLLHYPLKGSGKPVFE